MKRLMAGMVAAGLFLAGGGAAFEAVAGPRHYDLGILMYQPHPFAGPVAPTAWPSLLGPAPTAPGPAPARYRRASEDTSFFGSAGDGFLTGVSEFRGGILAHDRGPFNSNEEDGIDINFEILFHSPGLLNAIGSPRPHLGLSINTNGDTDQFYAGLTWEWEFLRRLFAGFSLGGAIHDGETETNRTDMKELGCRLLFRGSFELGYRINQRHGISVFLDHISNANICENDEGLGTIGFRYGYRL